jgi:LmbE family N-acetylglucosaminyl deacetylase
MARLATSGVRVVLVVATGGELGEPHDDGAGPAHLAAVRRGETELAANLLGVAHVEFLGYHDSGMAGDPANHAPGAFSAAPVDEVADRLATVLRDERADAIVVYDEFGIYGHPDHVAVHNAGRRAAALASVPTLYESTIDREYLHFVETHLVEEAILAGDLGLVRSHIGVPTVAVTNTVDVASVLGQKRAAMACHASQLPETTSALLLPTDQFGAVYGWEWFVRSGPRGPIDDLG